MDISLELGEVHVTSSRVRVLCSRRHNSLVNRNMELWVSVFDQKIHVRMTCIINKGVKSFCGY